MKLLIETRHPDTFSIAATVAHVELVERLRSLGACKGTRCAIASALLAGGLFSLAYDPLAERLCPRWSA